MPGSMIHLIVANRVNPEGSALFYLGNIAPDAIVNWHDKDPAHLRDLENRQPALNALAKKTVGDFAEGILLHLYCDWKWDLTIRQKYIDDTGDDWFVTYRNQLGLAGSYAFHHIEWAKQIWLEMDALDTGSYGTTPFATVEDVKTFVSRNNKWHNDNITDPSPAFTPDVIDGFAAQIAREYMDWRKVNGVRI